VPALRGYGGLHSVDKVAESRRSVSGRLKPTKVLAWTVAQAPAARARAPAAASALTLRLEHLLLAWHGGTRRDRRGPGLVLGLMGQEINRGSGSVLDAGQGSASQVGIGLRPAPRCAAPAVRVSPLPLGLDATGR